MKQTIFTLLIFFGGLSVLFGQQDSARVGFIPVTDSIYYIQIDGVTYPNLETIMLEKRTYDVNIWSPGRVVVDTFLDVSNKKSLSFVVPLNHTEAYKEYLYKMKKYKRKTFTKYVVVPSTIVTSTAYAYWNQSKAETLKKEAEYVRLDYVALENRIYSYRPEIQRAIWDLKKEYAEMQDQISTYENRRKAGFIAAGISTGVSTFFIMRIKAHKKSKPTYQTQPNPFELNTIGFNYNQNTPMINFSFTF